MVQRAESRETGGKEYAVFGGKTGSWMGKTKGGFEREVTLERSGIVVAMLPTYHVAKGPMPDSGWYAYLDGGPMRKGRGPSSIQTVWGPAKVVNMGFYRTRCCLAAAQKNTPRTLYSVSSVHSSRTAPASSNARIARFCCCHRPRRAPPSAFQPHK